MSKGAQLRQLIAQGSVMLPGVPNAAVARLVERAGFDAVYISGAGMANATAGVPDIGLLSMTEVVRLAGYIANAVAIPAIVDADTGFPEALQSSEEFKAFAREVKAPLLANMTEFGNSPLLSFQQLSDFGYRMVIFPMSAFRVSMKASEEFLHDLKKRRTQSGWLDKMQTRKELYELLDYDPNAESWSGR